MRLSDHPILPRAGKAAYFECLVVRPNNRRDTKKSLKVVAERTWRK